MKKNKDIIVNQIEQNNLDKLHNIIYISNKDTEENLNYFGLKVKSMGRNYEQDREFFDSASGAAYYLTEE